MNDDDFFHSLKVMFPSTKISSYEVLDCKRTGCVGCPCLSKALQELQIAEQYEPNKVKALFAVFGKSYEYREAYNRFKKAGGTL